MPRQDDELLTAFVDGVGELAPDERRRVEALLAADPDARADADATRDVLGALRALPAEGAAPDWAQLERRIRDAVAPLPVRPWWRRWQLIVPFGACLAGAAALAIWLGTAKAPVAPAAVAPPEVAHAAPAEPASPAPAATAAPDASDLVWVDDQAIDVGGLDADAIFGDLDREARDAMEADTVGDAGGILPAVDLGVVDNLDDSQLDAAAQALATDDLSRGGKG